MKSIDQFITRVAVSFAALLSVGTAARCFAQAPPVPTEYQDLYNTLSSDLNDFNTAVSGVWNGSPSPVLFTGQLTNANSNNGLSLLTSNSLPSVQNDLTMLKALGVQAVSVEVSFPMLYEPFFSNDGQYQQFVSFYAQVAAMVRANGFKLIVESQSMMPNGLGSSFGPQVAAFYPTLNWTQYQAARAQTAQVVAQTMQPDYMVLLEEPDTEATQSGQPNVDTVSGSVGMLDQIHSSVLLAGVPNLKIGAGLGSWLSGFQGFINGFTDQQCSSSQPCVAIPLDFVDMHIFPINELTNSNFWQNAMTIASMAQAAGKPVSVSQTWLRKVRDSEWGVLDGDTQESREVFSFWQPLDAAFLQTIVNFANYSQMVFCAPFNTYNFSTYLTYDDSTSGLAPTQLYSQELAQASTSLQQGSYSSTGISFYNSIVSPPDTIAPSAPGNLIATAGSPTLVNLTWTASADNIGVAGYYIYRNGTLLTTTSQLLYQDTSVSGYTTYTYQVLAYDLAFNASPAASVTVKTPNAAAPDPPANVVGTPASAQQVTLTWSPASQGVTPTSYLVLRGTSFDSMTTIQQLSGSTVTFKNYNLAANTTYYYGLEASAGGLNSGMSLIVVSTYPLPTAPGNLTATATSGKQVNLTWAASTGSLSIGSYKVFRGISQTGMSQLAQTTKTSYTDTTASPGTTYYYEVEGIDSAGDVSPMSNMASATTPAGGPSAPASVTATASSCKLVKLSWTAAAGNGLQVSNYHIYRGISSTNLSQLAITTALTYSDTTVAAGTGYYYGVEAVDSGGDVSQMSPLAFVTVPLPPSAPTGLTATPVSAKQIALAWTASVSGGLTVSNYHILRGTTPSNMSQLAVTTSTTYKDGTVSAGTTYYYAVQAMDTGGDYSANSTTVSVTAPLPPAPPGNVVGTAITHRQISLTWSAPSGGVLAITTYHVFRGTSPTSLSVVGSITAPTTSFTDNSVAPNSTYYYGVEAIDSGSDVSAMSAVVAVTTPN